MAIAMPKCVVALTCRGSRSPRERGYPTRAEKVEIRPNSFYSSIIVIAPFFLTEQVPPIERPMFPSEKEGTQGRPKELHVKDALCNGADQLDYTAWRPSQNAEPFASARCIRRQSCLPMRDSQRETAKPAAAPLHTGTVKYASPDSRTPLQQVDRSLRAQVLCTHIQVPVFICRRRLWHLF